MKNGFLVLAVAGVCIFGCFLMMRLDSFLVKNQANIAHSVSFLRIGFETPTIADSMDTLLEEFLRENPDCEMIFSYGSANEIENAVKNRDLDFGVLQKVSGNSLGKEIQSIALPVRQGAAACESADFPVQPLTETAMQTKVIWRSDKGYMKDIFLEMLRSVS